MSERGQLTLEQIEAIRLRADSGFIVDDDEWNTLCGMAEQAARAAPALDVDEAMRLAHKMRLSWAAWNAAPSGQDRAYSLSLYQNDVAALAAYLKGER